MILRMLLLACAILLPSSLAKLDAEKFGDIFEDMCFQNEKADPFRIHGQDTPLSNTLENFISMAEKFEAVNPNVDLKDELSYFISRYMFENIEISKGKVIDREVKRVSFVSTDKMWDPEQNGYQLSAEEPFTDDEKCSLYFMISHSLLKKDSEFLESYRPGNFSLFRSTKLEINPDDYFPQEYGVVAIRGTDDAVSLSKVLIGLYVGLKGNRITDLDSYEKIKSVPQENLPKDPNVDALYAVTLAEVLFLSQFTGSQTGMAKNGVWTSIPLSSGDRIEGFCPMVYKQEPSNTLPAYSYSSVRGATDGLILGLAADQVYRKEKKVKLSQILRMYYTRGGIALEENIEDTTVKQVSFCNRGSLMELLETKLKDQMQSYGYVIANKWSEALEAYKKAKTLYDDEIKPMYQNPKDTIQSYCNAPLPTLEKPEDLPFETSLDVIVVLDSSNTEKSFQEQQLITGYLAKQLDLRYTGSRMTILLDQRINSASATSSVVELKSILSDTSSSSCAACTVAQLIYEQSTIEREQVVLALDQHLQERKDNESSLSGVNGKFVVYFNYGNENGGNGNNKIQAKLDKVLQDFRLHHPDVLLYAVGLDTKLLEKYARKDPALIFLGGDGKPEVVANKIMERIAYAPGLLQYSDCKEAKNEKSAKYENFVSLNTIQHYKMPPEYFYKSYNVKFLFESKFGLIRVCYNQAERPENEAKHCKNTTVNTGVEFKISNPCKGLTKESCPPFYFAVMGADSNGINADQEKRRDYCKDMKDKWCSNLNQVNFQVTHEGVRCNGCLALGVPLFLILITELLSYFIYKRF